RDMRQPVATPGLGHLTNILALKRRNNFLQRIRRAPSAHWCRVSVPRAVATGSLSQHRVLIRFATARGSDDYLENDYSLEEFLECFPSVSRDLARQVLEQSERALLSPAA